MDQWLKRVQLLKEAVPQITRLGNLDTREGRKSDYGKKVHSAVREYALQNSFSIVGPPLEHPTDEQEYRRVFAALAQDGAEGLVVNDQAENVTYRKLIVELAEKRRLPTIYPYRQFVEAGGMRRGRWRCRSDTMIDESRPCTRFCKLLCQCLLCSERDRSAGLPRIDVMCH
jgi:putative tryptophan/tyrosine transport system substrate-binding protein